MLGDVTTIHRPICVIAAKVPLAEVPGTMAVDLEDTSHNQAIPVKAIPSHDRVPHLHTVRVSEHLASADKQMAEVY